MVLLYEFQELTNLVGLRLSTDFLQVDQLRYVWMDEHVMTATDAAQAETESLNQVDHVSKPHVVAGAVQESEQQTSSIHGQARRSSTCSRRSACPMNWIACQP